MLIKEINRHLHVSMNGSGKAAQDHSCRRRHSGQDLSPGVIHDRSVPTGMSDSFSCPYGHVTLDFIIEEMHGFRGDSLLVT